MREFIKELGKEETHTGSSMCLVNILTHGGDNGHLCGVNKSPGFHIPFLVGTLSDVEALRGKPKVFFISACRGRKYI